MSVRIDLRWAGRAVVVSLAWLLILAGGTGGTDGAPEGKAAGQQVAAEVAPQGLLVKVPLPITGNVDRRVVQQIRRALTEWKSADPPPADARRPVLILEFQPGQTEFGRGTEFEDALKLARFLISPQLDGVKTVAYLPRSIKGHAVLVAAACEQIGMAADAEFGDAGADHDADHPIDETIEGGYRQIARSRRTLPVEIALGMLDRQYQVLRVETEDGPQLIFAADLEALRETKTIDDDQTRVIFAAGEPGLLSGREARELGIAAYLAADRGQIAQHLGLPRNALQVARSYTEQLRARRIMLDRPLDAKLAETRLRMMQDAIHGQTNFLCLWIDAPGGDLEAATRLADFISQLDSEKVMTTAYVPSRATGTAALVALACDDVVMHPEALLGGGDQDLSAEQRRDVIAAIDDIIAPRKARSPALLAAMFQEDLVVHRYKNRRTGLTQYFTEQEFKQQEDPDQWQQEIVICDLGEFLEVDGNQAEQLGLAAAVVDNFEDFKQQYGLEDDPTLAKPNWVDKLVRALASPGLAWLLVMIGLAAVYAEIQMPGIGVGGFVAA
ncbi:MAG: hypothetical protein GTO03_07045, partial [Planctomycetales bacterium]|nr:hypothetical protein [Planctomycetales bacterium]